MRLALPAAVLALAASAAASSCPAPVRPNPTAPWPATPLITRGRDIFDANGKKIVFAGINWPGHLDAMVPEGLQYASVAEITSKIKQVGFNVVRLTFATEMVDDIYSSNPNQTLKASLVHALGAANGTRAFDAIVKHNPTLTAASTRLDVFDYVAAELARQQIYLHLDNHVSKAIWCCNLFDGNGWFKEKYFDTDKWARGLSYMAGHAARWPAFTSIALRNELRPGLLTAPYTWATWAQYMVPAAQGIYAANKAPLIFFSGINGDKTLSAPTQNDLVFGLLKGFNVSSFAFRDKLVWELHYYQLGPAPSSCDSVAKFLYDSGYGAMNLSDSKFVNHAPVVISEFGISMNDGSAERIPGPCVPATTTKAPGGPGGLMQWVLAGSYLIREGLQDYEETYGLLSHDWSTYRNQTVVDTYVKKWVAATLA